MSCTFLSNKNSSAPVWYILLQASVLTGIALLSQTIIEFKENWIIILFWVDVAITLVLYFKAHYKDPGYVPHDAVFYTENDHGEQESHLNKSFKKQESQMRLKGESRIEDNNESMVHPGRIELKEKFEFEDKNGRKRTRQESFTHPVASTSDRTRGQEKDETSRKFQMRSENMLQEDQSQVDEEKDIEKHHKVSFGNPDENELMNAEKPTNHNSRQSPNHQSNQQIKDEINDEYIIDCEPSMEDENEDDGYVSPQFQELNNQSVNQIDQIELMVTKENEISPNNKKLQSKLIELQDQATTAITEQRVQTKTPKRESTQERELNSSCNIRAQTGDEDSSKIIRMQDLLAQNYHPLNEEEGLTARNEGLAKIPSAKIAEMHESYIEKKNLETSCMEAPSERGGPFGKLASEVKKYISQPSIEIMSSILESSKKKESQAEAEAGEKKQSERDDYLYVERRYCTICSLEQPLRTKHCQECKKCVAQYDHHCPWIGTCIGEKNHTIFYFYLIFQSIEIVWGEYSLVANLVRQLDEESLSINFIKALLALFILFFLVMVVSLLIFHTYLATSNMTTWESLSWKKISYLKEWKEEWGSPFSKGTLKNIKIYCCGQSEFHKWNMPQYKKSSK